MVVGSWKPHQRSSVPKLMALRWAALHPLQKRLGNTGFTIGEVFWIGFSLVVGGGALFSEGVEGSGELASKALGMTFATAAHNSVFTFCIGLPFERAIFWHKFFAALTLVASAWHVYVAYTDEGGEEGSSWWSSNFILGGLVSVGAMTLLVITGLVPRFRRKAFELFFRLHWVGCSVYN
jgi:hypothetical protein